MPQNSQKTLIIAFIIILGFAAGYLYYSQFVVSSVPIIPPPIISGKDDLKSFQSLKIDFSLLDNQRYKILEVFGESPVSPGVTGKKDIFAPI